MMEEPRAENPVDVLDSERGGEELLSLALTKTQRSREKISLARQLPDGEVREGEPLFDDSNAEIKPTQSIAEPEIQYASKSENCEGDTGTSGDSLDTSILNTASDARSEPQLQGDMVSTNSMKEAAPLPVNDIDNVFIPYPDYVFNQERYDESMAKVNAAFDRRKAKLRSFNPKLAAKYPDCISFDLDPEEEVGEMPKYPDYDVETADDTDAWWHFAGDPPLERVEPERHYVYDPTVDDWGSQDPEDGQGAKNQRYFSGCNNALMELKEELQRYVAATGTQPKAYDIDTRYRPTHTLSGRRRRAAKRRFREFDRSKDPSGDPSDSSDASENASERGSIFPIYVEDDETFEGFFMYQHEDGHAPPSPLIAIQEDGNDFVLRSDMFVYDSDPS